MSKPPRFRIDLIQYSEFVNKANTVQQNEVQISLIGGPLVDSFDDINIRRTLASPLLLGLKAALFQTLGFRTR
jgi:hypothetical protein